MTAKTTRLRELCTLITKGTTPTSIGHAFADSGVAFLRVQNITNGMVNFAEDTLFINEDVHVALKRSQILPGDVLISIAGTIGRTGIVPDSAPDLNCNQAVAIIRTTEAVFRPFLRHWLDSAEAQEQMRGVTVTGTIQNLSLTQLGELKVPLPSLPEQRRIAAILDQADALRAKRREALAQLDKLAQAIFVEMFGDSTTNSMGLAKQPLASITEISTGSTPSRSTSSYYGGTCSWVKTTEVIGDLILDSEEKLTVAGLKSIRGKIHPVDSIVVAMYGQGQTRGRCGLLGIEAACNQACGVIRPSPKFNPLFMFHQLRLSYERLRALGRGGNQENLNLQLLGGFEVLLPSITMQDVFVRKIKVINDIKAKYRVSIAELDKLFAALQHRAFRGEL